MTNTELVAFLRHFADTRDWATWSAIADRYEEEGDEVGAEIALRIQRERYWPHNGGCWLNVDPHNEYRWFCERDFPMAVQKDVMKDCLVPDEADSAVYDVEFDKESNSFRRRYPCATVVDAYRRLIDAFRDGMTRKVK